MSHGPLTTEIEGWLVRKALSDPDIVSLFERLCQRLHALGLPLARAALSWPTLHPLFRAEQIFWHLGEGAKLERYYHAAEPTEAFLKSPFHHAQVAGVTRLRRRLDGPAAMVDFEVLEELRDKGFTDYLLTFSPFAITTVSELGPSGGIMASWATKRPDGFTDDDLEALKRIQTLLAVACRAAIQKRIMSNLGEAYLGRTAGGQVLSGDIRRGDGSRIKAVVWFSDLRDSTRLSDEMDPDDYLALVNRYYECTAQPVIDEGGEVLNFIGDGVLGIFPVDGCGIEAAAARAEAAVARSLRCHEAVFEGRPFTFGIGLALGEVMFGNIGVPGRLAFSAIGRVVNQVQRVEKATKDFGQPVLATAPFARYARDGWTKIGELDRRDFAEGVCLYAQKAEEGVEAAE